jgi:hypothetical protein
MSELRVCGEPKASGQPCGWKLNGRECPYHGPNATPESRRLVPMRGGEKSRLLALQVMPPDTAAPRWRSRSQIVSWLEEQARLVLVGDLDPRLASEARQHAEVALKAYELSAMEKLDAFERVIAGKARRVL